jgi:antitoxin MazE
MQTTIVKIGNSQGLIIPKRLLTSLGDVKKFDMQLKDGGLLLVPSIEESPRQDWEKQFAMAIHNGHKPENDIEYLDNEFDNADWTW